MPDFSSASITERNVAPRGISTSTGSFAVVSGVETYHAPYPAAASTARTTSPKRVFRECCAEKSAFYDGGTLPAEPALTGLGLRRHTARNDTFQRPNGDRAKGGMACRRHCKCRI